MGIVSLLFAIYLTAIATMSCRSKEMAYKIWVSSFVDRIIWWILAPIDVLLLFSVVMHGGLTLLNWGSFLDTPLILMLFYFSSCVEAPPKQKKEQLKTAYA